MIPPEVILGIMGILLQLYGKFAAASTSSRFPALPKGRGRLSRGLHYLSRPSQSLKSRRMTLNALIAFLVFCGILSLGVLTLLR
jgi:hypothetical protein